MGKAATLTRAITETKGGSGKGKGEIVGRHDGANHQLFQIEPTQIHRTDCAADDLPRRGRLRPGVIARERLFTFPGSHRVACLRVCWAKPTVAEKMYHVFSHIPAIHDEGVARGDDQEVCRAFDLGPINADLAVIRPRNKP